MFNSSWSFMNVSLNVSVELKPYLAVKLTFLNGMMPARGLYTSVSYAGSTVVANGTSDYNGTVIGYIESVYAMHNYSYTVMASENG